MERQYAWQTVTIIGTMVDEIDMGSTLVRYRRHGEQVMNWTEACHAT